MNKLVEFFKNFKFIKEPIPTKDELYIKSIVERFLKDEDIKKLVNPIQQEYFLIDSKSGVNILIRNSNIEISNHKFLYRRQVSLSFSDALAKKVAIKIGEDVQKVKKELFKNEIDLLRNILKDE